LTPAPIYNRQPAILLATLGSEAQVVTAAMDLLLRQGERIDEVQVIHTVTVDASIAAAVELLKQEFASGALPTPKLLHIGSWRMSRAPNWWHC
jgi:hypothetical protein